MTKQDGTRFDVIVIGGGQAGLSVGYHLARRGLRFVILDGHARIGDAWRKRWDSLRLFSPARHDGLDGMPFPAPPTSCPTKDEMADYLEAYAAHFELPVLTGVTVNRLSRVGEHFVDRGGRAKVRGRAGGGRDVRLSAAAHPGVRASARPEHRAAALG